MDATPRALFLVAAVILFVIAAVIGLVNRAWAVALIAAALACGFLPAAWDALAAT